MADQLLSQSIASNTEDSQTLRDPFAMAKAQYDSRQNQGSLLSQSPAQAAPIQPQAPPDFAPAFQGLGIDTTNIAMSDIGKFQLINRVKDKFGDNYAQNPDVLKALDGFDSQLKFLGSSGQKNMNESLANASRTLSTILKL